MNAEMGEVLFQDGEFRGGGRGGGDAVVFCAVVLDDHLEPLRHRVERARRRVQHACGYVTTLRHYTKTGARLSGPASIPFVTQLHQRDECIVSNFVMSVNRLERHQSNGTCYSAKNTVKYHAGKAKVERVTRNSHIKMRTERSTLPR